MSQRWPVLGFQLGTVTLLVLGVTGLHAAATVDWLVDPPSTKATVVETCWDYEGTQLCGLELANGLVSRRFVISPGFGTIDYILNTTLQHGGEESMFRNVHPEAEVTIDGSKFSVGGLAQVHGPLTRFLAYCNRSEFQLENDPSGFQYRDHTTSMPEAPFAWTPGSRGSPTEYSWPPKGVHLAVRFTPPTNSSKWAVVHNFTGKKGVTTRQETTLPAPVKAQRFRLACESTYSQYQLTLPEVEFLLDGKWTNNSQNTATNTYVTGASGWQPNGAFGGEPWRAADGRVDTNWDSANGAPYWLEVDFGKPVSLSALAVYSGGDTTHDGQEFQLSMLAVTPLNIDLELTLHYELYDGIPLISKWVTAATTGKDVILDSVVVEEIGVMPRFGAYLTHGSFSPYADGGGSSETHPPPSLLHFKTDQAHGAVCSWHDDFPNSASPVAGCPSCKDEGAVEPFIQCGYSIGPGAHVNANESFTSFRVLALATDSTDLTRHTLMRHRATQLLAPHTTENPIFFHATKVDDAGFRAVVDQMVETGFEMLIFSFGSGFNLETGDPAYLAKITEQIAYAASKGIEVGGYDLVCLDRGHGGYGGNVGDQWVAVEDDGSLSEDACFASGWYDKLHGLVANFINTTGLAMLETDGPYGGRSCAAETHDHHHGHEDSVYRQTQQQSQFFKEMRALGVYVNQPDDYFFQGGSRTGMGYDEQQYSLPRFHDLSISRMGMYDDLYVHLPTQGWMFVPLIPYHGGGDEAAFFGHLDAYEWAFAQYLGAGTAACYRGDLVFWDDASKAVAQKWVTFYKAHRGTIIQPVVHLRRANMQGWDGWLHVNPFSVGGAGTEVGVAMLFNPTDAHLDLTLALPLYYCGLSDSALISVNGNAPSSHALARDFSVYLRLSLPPRSIHTLVISRP